MDPFFAQLGRTVLERWERQDFALARFPEIARAALDERPPARHLDVPAFVRDFLLHDDQTPQTQSGFGQPELVVYAHPRFYIQVLFWLDGTTDIHQHEFSGAFHVLAGSSLHARFTFETAQAVTAHLRIGDLRVNEIALLETGRTVPIVSGPGFIHSLFHLDTPSITVVVRTHHDPEAGAQLNYLPPHVALDPRCNDALMNRRRQLLDVLEQSADPSYPEVVLDMIAALDFTGGFVVLQQGMAHLQHLDAWTLALAAFREKHGALAAGIEATLGEMTRRDVLIALRSTITDPEHRFFLALLLNVPTRIDLLALVSQRFPEDAATTTVLRWAAEMQEPSDVGTTILDAEFPESLAIAPAAQPDLFLTALRHFIEGGGVPPSPLRRLQATEVGMLHAAFARSSLRILLATN